MRNQTSLQNYPKCRHAEYRKNWWGTPFIYGHHIYSQRLGIVEPILAISVKPSGPDALPCVAKPRSTASRSWWLCYTIFTDSEQSRREKSINSEINQRNGALTRYGIIYSKGIKLVAEDQANPSAGDRPYQKLGSEL